MIERLVCFVLLTLLLSVSTVHAARMDVLIVVNENSIDSPQLGEYYALKRDIDPARIVRVRVPNQYLISWYEFRSLRDQILRFGVCPSIQSTSRPAACDDASLPIYTADVIAQLTAKSPVRYVVMTRGVPTRMRVDGSQFGSEPTSVDNYLRFWLARFISNDVGLSFSERTNALGANSPTGWLRNLRSVQPATDLEYVIGRIDGVTLQSAKALVDRTLQAEEFGPMGRLYTNQDQILPWRYAFGLFDERRPECTDDLQSTHYLNNPESTDEGKAPPHCLVKVVKSNSTQYNENMPGISSSRQPIVDSAVTYLGHLDGQTMQGGFETLLRWRKIASCTNTLCRDSQDPAGCRNESIDPFKEIDTRCVGVEPGFIGFNYQSYPVARFGVWPTAWEIISSTENDVPRVSGAVGSDGPGSAWFDNADEVVQPECYQYSAGLLSPIRTPCRAKRYPAFQQWLPIQGMDPAQPRPLSVRFKVIAENLAQPTSMRATLAFMFEAPANGCPANTVQSTTQCRYAIDHPFQVSNGSTWQTVAFSVTPAAFSGFPGINSLAFALVGNPHTGSVGIDEISVMNDSGIELVRNGSFDQGFRQSALGDYAANFLDRMGGVGFWGSLSHHQSGGHSFYDNSLRSLAFLTRGLPLGDAVWLGETKNSGILYGDPLYAPTAIRILGLADGSSRFFRPTNLSILTRYGHDSSARTIKVSACRGTDASFDEPRLGALKCDRNESWKTLQGGELFYPTGSGYTTVPIIPNGDTFQGFGDYVLRLQVTRTNPATGESHTLNDFYPVAYRYTDAELSLGSVSGKLIYQSGQPAAVTSLAITDNEGLVKPVITNFAGEYALKGLRAGTYMVSVSPSGAARGCTQLVPNASQTFTIGTSSVQLDLTCAFDSQSSIRGKVVDPQGRPLAGLRMVATPVGGINSVATNSASDGTFTLGGLTNQSYTVSTSAPRWQFTSVVAPPGNSQIQFVGTPLPGDKVSVYVFNTAFRPISGAVLTVKSLGSTTSFRSGNVSDANGFIAVTGLTAGTYEATVQAAGFTTSSPMVLSSNSAAVTITLSPSARYSVMGYVDVSSDPVYASPWTISLLTIDGETLTTRTAYSGFYRFDGLADGIYILKARNEDLVAEYPEQWVNVSDTNVIDVNFPAAQ